MIRNVTKRLLASDGVPFNPFEVPGAWDGYIADEGITVVAGAAIQALDQTGNGNTIARTPGPDFVPVWRHGRAAMLGTLTTYLERPAHVQGALNLPLTRYTVGSWTGAANRVLVRGTVAASPSTRSVSGTNAPRLTCGGLALAAGTAPAIGAAFVQRDVFGLATMSLRVEPEGAAPIVASGACSPTPWNGINWGGPTTWNGHFAFLLDVAGDLPATAPMLDAQIMQWLREYYDIFHS